MQQTDEFNQLLDIVTTQFDKFSADQLVELQKALKHIEVLEAVEKAKTDFLTFVRLVGPPSLVFSSFGQHKKMSEVFGEVVDGEKKRVMISMPPRFSKSTFASIFLPAWFIGKYPDKKIMQISATEDLATDFGRTVKSIIESPMYQRIFPGVKLAKDSKAAGKFAIQGHAGVYFALGIKSNMAGKGGDLIIVDDPTTEQDARSGDPESYNTVWSLFHSGPRQRLQPGGRIIVVQTRWAKADIIGRIKSSMAEDPNYERYESIEFPALDPETDQSTFPEFWPTAQLHATRAAQIKINPAYWYGPYQQEPTSSETSMIPSTAWRKWSRYQRIAGTVDEVEFVPPECFFILMILDTAETENKRSNPTACTVFGIFDHDDKESGRKENQIILLHSYAEKLEFHRLKRVARKWIEDWKPDKIIVEAKSTGPALRSELAEAGIFTSPKRPKPGEDKRSRLAAVSDVFHSNKVWYIPTAANEVTVTQVADFPNGLLDDLVDCVSYGVGEFRSGGLVKTDNDRHLKEDIDTPPVDRRYY